MYILSTRSNSFLLTLVKGIDGFKSELLTLREIRGGMRKVQLKWTIFFSHSNNRNQGGNGFAVQKNLVL